MIPGGLQMRPLDLMLITSNQYFYSFVILTLFNEKNFLFPKHFEFMKNNGSPVILSQAVHSWKVNSISSTIA